MPEHQTTIVINAREYPWTQNQITYEQVIELAYPGQPVTPEDSIIIRFSRGHDGHGSGALDAGQSVAVKKGMVFDAVRTARS